MNLFNIMAKIGLDDTGFNKGLDDADRKGNGFAGTLGKIGGAVAGAFAVKKVFDWGVAVTKVGIDYNATMETSAIAWETLLGSQEASNKMLKDIEKFASTTPFDKMGVDNMAKQLNNAGLKGDDLFAQLKKFGDMGGAFGVQQASLEEMVRQYSQVKQAGTAYTEDLNILQDRGIPIYKAIADECGISTAEVKKWASEGKISADIYQSALDNVAKSVEGGMEKQSKSFSGMMSTLKDNFNMIAGLLTQPIFDTLKEGLSFVLPLLDGFSGALSENGISGAVQFLWDKFNETFPQLGVIVGDGFGKIMDIWNTILKPCLYDITNIIKNILYPIFQEYFINMIVPVVQTAFQFIADAWNVVGKPLFDTIVGIIYYLYEQFQEYFPLMKETFDKAMTEIKSVWENNLKPTFDAIVGFIQGVLVPLFKWAFENIILPVVGGAFKSIGNLWNNSLKPIFTGICDFIKGVLTLDFKSAFTGIVNIVSGCFNVVGDICSGFVDIGKNIVQGLWNGITSMGSWIINKITGFFGGIVNTVKKTLKIFSPSRVFRDEVGAMMAQGVGVGFEDEMDGVNKDISNAINTSFDLDNTQQFNPYGGALEEVVGLLKNLLNKDNSLNVDGRELTRALAPYNDELTSYSMRNNPLLSY